MTPSPLFSPIPTDELRHEEGRVAVRGWDEPNTRRPVRVSVHDEVVDGLELSPSTTRPTKKESMQMKDEPHGEVTRIVLEQVVERITVPSQFHLVADAESLVGTADESYNRKLWIPDLTRSATYPPS